MYNYQILFNLVKEFELRASYLVSSHSTIDKARVKEADKKLQSWVKENDKRMTTVLKPRPCSFEAKADRISEGTMKLY